MGNAGALAGAEPSLWLQGDPESLLGVRDLYPIRLELAIGMIFRTLYDSWSDELQRPIVLQFYNEKKDFSFYRQQRGGKNGDGNIYC